MSTQMIKNVVLTIDSFLVDTDGAGWTNLSELESSEVDGGIIPLIIAVAIAAEFCEGVAIGAAIGSVVYSLSH